MSSVLCFPSIDIDTVLPVGWYSTIIRILVRSIIILIITILHCPRRRNEITCYISHLHCCHVVLLLIQLLSFSCGSGRLENVPTHPHLAKWGKTLFSDCPSHLISHHVEQTKLQVP